MDIFTLLMNAKIEDTNDTEYGEVLSISFSNGRLTIVIDTDEDDDEPDDGSKEPIPVESFSPKLRAVGGKKVD